MDGTGEIDTTDAIEALEKVATGAEEVVDNNEPQERDYEAEARAHGWLPEGEFKGDKAKCVDAKTFVERADTFMPFLQKQNKALKREIDDLKRTTKQFATFASKAEERAYTRALADLQSRHDEAVEAGDVPGARKVLKELHELQPPETVDAEEAVDPKKAQQELADWVDENDWYVNDDKKRAYADIQAGAMGPAAEWDGGAKAWLEELGKRVNRKFAEQKPNPTNGGGNRPGGPRGSKTFADLPAQAKAQCERFVKQIPGFTKEQYVKDFDWS
jgi:hypothetical protein